MTLAEVFQIAPTAKWQEVMSKCNVVVQDHEKIAVSISGGSDSDIMIDILARLELLDRCKFIWFDTGLEYQATKDHLAWLEAEYGFEIQRLRGKTPIPISVKKYGSPFLSKLVSKNIKRLQDHGFQWEDEPLSVLAAKYCEEIPKADATYFDGSAKKGIAKIGDDKYFRGCFAALRWWCNDWGDGSMLNIGRNKLLKEFIIENPPDFYISDRCCHYSKKAISHDFQRMNDCDLQVTGERKAEGGERAAANKTCYSEHIDGADRFRMLFWVTDQDKRDYEEHFHVCHSACYEEWGMKRTGCACCPFGRNFEQELALAKEHEPKLYKAANAIFGKSYDYTRRYRQFVEEHTTGQIKFPGF